MPLGSQRERPTLELNSQVLASDRPPGANLDGAEMCECGSSKPFVQLGIEAHGAYLLHRDDPDKSLSLALRWQPETLSRASQLQRCAVTVEPESRPSDGLCVHDERCPQRIREVAADDSGCRQY